jgi:hypothetical protein
VAELITFLIALVLGFAMVRLTIDVYGAGEPVEQRELPLRGAKGVPWSELSLWYGEGWAGMRHVTKLAQEDPPA